MKFFIAAFVIAFILEDYGTFQAKPIADCTPTELVLAFKTYALELVNAAARPILLNGDIMNGGCECVSGVNKGENLNAIDAILAIMSTAKHHYHELQVMRFSQDFSAIENDRKLMENIRKILVVLERLPLSFDKSRIQPYFAPYLWKYKRDMSRAQTRVTKLDILSAGLNCYRTMVSLCMGANAQFLDQLVTASNFIRKLMTSDDVEDWEYVFAQLELNEIVCGHAEHEAYGLADVAHTSRLELAVRSSSPGWYHDGMQLFAYLFNGYKWGKTDLTWAIVEGSSKIPVDRVMAAAKKAFELWSAVTPFRFSQVSTDLQKADIKISFQMCEEKNMLCDTKFPAQKGTLDKEGVTIVINDEIGWTSRPYTPNWHNFNFAMLYEVTHCLGLDTTTVEESVMNKEHRRFKMGRDYDLGDNDIIGIQQLYHFPRCLDRIPPTADSSSSDLTPPQQPQTGNCTDTHAAASSQSDPTPPQQPQ